MKEREILNGIANALKSGGVYGEMVKGTNPAIKRPFFWKVLSFGYCQNSGLTIWRWRHYGSSANPATLKDLKWILDTIFKMKPSEFVAKYVLKTSEDLRIEAAA